MLIQISVFASLYKLRHTNREFNKQNVIKVPTRTKLHPQLEVNAVTNFHTIPTGVYMRTQANTYIPRQPICLTDSDYGYILEEIGRQDKIGFERDV